MKTVEKVQHLSGRRIYLVPAYLFGFALLDVGAVAAQAQEKPGMLEEVIVTARKRREVLQDTPVAVTALSNEELTEANIRDLGDLVRVVPGLSRREGEKFGGFSIRGIGSRAAQTVAIDPSIGVYVDGIYVPRTDSQLLDVISLESVQVLRGPQGTLFGKNTAGGALLMTSIKPHEELSGELSTDIGNLDRVNLAGNLNVPLTDNLYARFTVDSRKRDGYMDDAVTGVDYGDEDKIAYVAQFRWLPRDDLTVDLLAFYSEQDENSAPVNCIVRNDISGFESTLSRLTVPGDSRLMAENCAESESLEGRDEVRLDTSGQVFEIDSSMLGLTLDWELDHFTLKSITGWLNQDNVNLSRDQDGTAQFTIQNSGAIVEQLEANGFTDGEEREFLSQEFQLVATAFDDRLDYTVGVFGSTESIDDSPFPLFLAPGGFAGFPTGDSVFVLPPSTSAAPSMDDYDNDTWAVFAQGSWYFDEQWSVTLGGRYSNESRKVKRDGYQSTETVPVIMPREEFDALIDTIHSMDLAFSSSRKEDWDAFTPSGSIRYIAGDEFLDRSGLDSFMGYLTVSEGFKSGSFSPVEDEFFDVDPEEVLNIEIGLKLDALDNRLRLNTAVYSMQYDDMQLFVTRQLDEINTVPLLTNAGESTITGIEIELNYLPTANWYFQVTGNYIDAEYDDFEDLNTDDPSNPVPVDRSNEDFAYVPEKSFSWFGQYSWATNWGQLAARVSGSYRDEVFTSLSPGNEDASQAYLDDLTLWNARISWESPDQSIDIAVYVDNLADEEYFSTGTIDTERVLVTRGMSRTYGVQARYFF